MISIDWLSSHRGVRAWEETTEERKDKLSVEERQTKNQQKSNGLHPSGGIRRIFIDSYCWRAFIYIL